MKKHLFVQSALCLLLFFICTCLESDKENSTKKITDFSKIFPADLVFASPSANAIPSTLKLLEKNDNEPSDGETYSEKKEFLSAMFSGTEVTDCAFAFKPQLNISRVECFAPSVTVINHPDALITDTDKIDKDAMGANDTDGDATTGGGDGGIWAESTADGEACASAQLTKVVTGIEDLANSSIYAMASVACIATANSLSLGEGETLDVTEYINDGFEVNNVDISVTVASIQENSGNYTLSLSGNTITSDGYDQTVDCRLNHENNTDGIAYLGKLSCSVATDTGTKEGNCNESTSIPTGKTDAISVIYQKNSSSIFSYELTAANFCGASSVEPYGTYEDDTSNYIVDPTKKINTPAQPGTDLSTGWANNFNFYKTQFNVDTGEGLYNAAWQAGYGDSNTRTMNVEMKADGTGCAYFGFGPDAEDADIGTIDGMRCNWSAPGANGTMHDLVQKQCMKKNTTSGVYESVSTSTKIKYAPTNSCDATGTDKNGNPFKFTDDTTLTVFDYDGSVDGEFTNDLFDITTMPDVSVPDPTDIDKP